jgi:uncharacterized membrane protein
VTPGHFRALVSDVLIIGVVTSAVLMTVGFAGSLVVGWEGSLRGLPAATSPASDFSAVVPAVLVVRVTASVVAFVLERDRLYAAITLGVLAILLVSLVGLR